MAVGPAIPAKRSPTPLARLFGGGIRGNERLTAATGIALIVLLAVIGLTLLRLQSLISVHLFVGLLLIPPVLLKLASTGYRFARYYTSHPSYRERGAPPALLRLSAPVVVLSTLGVFATGVALLLVGPTSAGPLRFLHKGFFIVWVGFTGLHVLGHLPDLPRAFLSSRREDTGHAALASGSGPRLSESGLRLSESGLRYSPHAAGGMGRAISLASALVAGIVLAILLIPHFGAWGHWEHLRVDR